ncbi:MAG TPA: DNA repair protein RecN, partial [Prolixibacteraceae bacterium]|nr:DNA repair protein RecN [Prolixibacteraceae bacterium]
RADYSLLRNPDRKCIVECGFRLEGPGWEEFFTQNDLDFDPLTILRREISSSGKSRAFINDTPVTLQQLHELSVRLIDIHSQHQNLELGTRVFQLQLVDNVAGNKHLSDQFREAFRAHQEIGQRLAELKTRAARSKSDLDYLQFQFNQLAEARLQAGEQTELEEERNALSHAEEIKGAFDRVSELLQGDHYPVIPRIREAVSRLEKIAGYLREASGLAERLRSAEIELKDLAYESERLSEKTAYDPQRLSEVTERLDLIFTLEQKHQLPSVEELIALRDDLDRRIREIGSFDEEITQLSAQVEQAAVYLKNAAVILTGSRKKVLSPIETKVTGVLKQLGMPHARFTVDHSLKSSFQPSGADDIQFLFSANRDTPPSEISKIASGGEISRVMLAHKTLVSNSGMLATILFDEIDSGISGETALKMAGILKELSRGIQVINITHLPQIAGKGDTHFRVAKNDDGSGTRITITRLAKKDRVEELARMLGGDDPSDAAVKTAREMLS